MQIISGAVSCQVGKDIKPRWIRDEPLPLIDGVLNWFDYGVETRPYRSSDQGPVGGSFGVRRRLLERLGRFRVDLGRIGAGLGRGEETEFLDRARQIDAKGIYVGQSLCWHMIDRRRLSLAMLFRYGIASGRALRSLGADYRIRFASKNGLVLIARSFSTNEG